MGQQHSQAAAGLRPADRGNEQFPVDTKVFTKVQLYTDVIPGDLLRIVVTNDQQTSECAPHREYNHADTGVSIDDVTSFTMRCGRMEPSQQEVDTFVGGMSLELDIPQVMAWQRGVYNPSAARRRLYKAVDPDDSTRMIGLLIEQDAQGRLVALTWYKTRDTGTVFRVAPEALPFVLVMGQGNLPSVDPNDIGGWTWYYTTSGST
jgi:hypothetical protein